MRLIVKFKGAVRTKHIRNLGVKFSKTTLGTMKWMNLISNSSYFLSNVETLVVICPAKILWATVPFLGNYF